MRVFIFSLLVYLVSNTMALISKREGLDSGTIAKKSTNPTVKEIFGRNLCQFWMGANSVSSNSKARLRRGDTVDAERKHAQGYFEFGSWACRLRPLAKLPDVGGVDERAPRATGGH